MVFANIRAAQTYPGYSAPLQISVKNSMSVTGGRTTTSRTSASPVRCLQYMTATTDIDS
jgi:hypothetical protein